MKVLFKIGVSLGLIMLVLAYSGCEEECGEDVLLGDLSLSSTSIDFLPYRGGQELVFEDSLGNDILLSSTDGFHVSSDKLSVELLCSQRFISSQSTFYNAEFRSIRFVNTDSTIIFDLGLEFNVLETGLDNDIFLFQSFSITSNWPNSLRIVTDTESNFPELELSLLTEEVTRIDTLVLRDQKFFDVYTNTFDQANNIYFNQKSGIVGFVDPSGNQYILK